MILLRYHEIALKGDNRDWFVDRLAQNARKILERDLEIPKPIRIIRRQSRILLDHPWTPAVRSSLEKVFGLAGFGPVTIVPTDRDAILKSALEEFRLETLEHGMPKTFAVRTRRTEKAIPETSGEFDRFIGGELFEAFPGMTVDLDHPELTLGIEIHRENSFLWVRKYKGPGGLPVGTNSRVLALMSGGLDSPVAAIRSLKRGADVSYLHFHGTPFVGEDALTKVEDLCRILNRYQPKPKPLLVVPFGKIQEKIALVTDSRLRTVLYRRMMVRIACAVARTRQAQALVTGEALGQVASQTMDNLAVINSVTTLPILRPLITHDKEEIIDEAKHWGTYEISIRPGLDCCTLFADRHPSTRATPEGIAEQEKNFPVEELVKEGLEKVEIRRC